MRPTLSMKLKPRELFLYADLMIPKCVIKNIETGTLRLFAIAQSAFSPKMKGFLGNKMITIWAAKTPSTLAQLNKTPSKTIAPCGIKSRLASGMTPKMAPSTGSIR